MALVICCILLIDDIKMFSVMFVVENFYYIVPSLISIVMHHRVKHFICDLVSLYYS